MKLLVFPTLRQTYGYDCGAKSAQGVLEYYGIDVREDEIMKCAGTKRSGTPIKGIMKVFAKYGLKSKAEKLTIAKLKRFIDRKMPVIIDVQAWSEKKGTKWGRDWNDGHYVVVIGYDKKKIYFQDPYSLLRDYLTYSELDERWHDVDVNGKRYVDYGIVAYGKRRKFSEKKFVHME